MAKRRWEDTDYLTDAGRAILNGTAPGIIRNGLPWRPDHSEECAVGDLSRCARCSRNTTSRPSGKRDANGVNERDRIMYAFGTDPRCLACTLRGTWDADHDATLHFGHVVPVAAYGSTNGRNIAPIHAFPCNAWTGDLDARPFAPALVTPWPTAAATAAYKRTRRATEARMDDTRPLPTRDEIIAAYRARVVIVDDGAAYALP